VFSYVRSLAATDILMGSTAACIWSLILADNVCGTHYYDLLRHDTVCLDWCASTVPESTLKLETRFQRNIHI